MNLAKRTIIISVFFCLSFALAAFGQNQPAPNVFSNIDKAYRAKSLTLDQKVLYKFYATSSRRKLPSKYSSAADRPIKCATPAYVDFHRNKSELSPSTIQQVLSMAPAAPAQSGQTYTSPDGHFDIHYTTTGTDAVPTADNNGSGIPDYVETVAAAADSAYRYEVQTLGYSDPLITGSNYEITIADIGAGLYGYTSTSTGNTTTSITVHNNFDDGFPSNDHPDGNQVGDINVTIAHELKHAIQFEANNWSGETADWLEMDATLMEEVTYDNVNDYYNYLESNDSIFSDPSKSFFPGSYYHVSWALFFQEYYGEQFWVNVWQIISNNPNITMVDAMSQKLGGSQAFKKAYARSQIWHYAVGDNSSKDFGFDEGKNYPTPPVAVQFFGEDSLAVPGTLSPLSARYYTVTSSPFSGSIAVNAEGVNSNDITVGLLGYFDDGTISTKIFTSQNNEQSNFKTGWEWSDLKKVGVVAANSRTISMFPKYNLRIRSVNPSVSKLEQNYPNPFSKKTSIRFSTTQKHYVKLQVFDVLGRKVRTLVDGQLNAGIYTHSVSGKQLGSGVYFYRLTLDGKSETQKMTLVK